MIGIKVGRIIELTEDSKDTYRCIIEVLGGGRLNGIPTRFENEPKEDDEVLCITLDDPFGNDCIYIPLKTLSGKDFVGIARQGFQLLFDDNGIHLRGKADDYKVNIDLTEDKLTLDADGSKVEMQNGKVTVTDGTGKISMSNGKLEFTGWSGTIKMGGKVTPTGNGPFCGLPNCLFTGAPHSGDIVIDNK